MTDKIKEQILAIRDTGLTNMFDVNAVQRIADEMEFYELVIFLEEEKAKYVKFILNGDEDLIINNSIVQGFERADALSLVLQLQAVFFMLILKGGDRNQKAQEI